MHAHTHSVISMLQHTSLFIFHYFCPAVNSINTVENDDDDEASSTGQRHQKEDAYRLLDYVSNMHTRIHAFTKKKRTQDFSSVIVDGSSNQPANKKKTLNLCYEILWGIY